jgi:hypothetical protein
MFYVSFFFIDAGKLHKQFLFKLTVKIIVSEFIEKVNREIL